VGDARAQDCGSDLHRSPQYEQHVAFGKLPRQLDCSGDVESVHEQLAEPVGDPGDGGDEDALTESEPVETQLPTLSKPTNVGRLTNL
jgi:hypothetical protein